jgi:quercetin dioxygenase-like cupin family protein
MHETFSNQAEAFLLGALDHSAEKQFLEHLASGCVECKKTVAALSRVMRALPFALQPALASATLVETPPTALKKRLLRSAKTVVSGASPAHKNSATAGPQIWKTWSATPDRAIFESGYIMCRAHEGEWEDTGVNGIKVKRLFVDPARDHVTMLVRMPAGASYPRHRHAAAEQCYVIEGDLHVGDTILRAGDYQCADADSMHGVQFTEGGCLLLIVSSQHDEIMEEHEA